MVANYPSPIRRSLRGSGKGIRTRCTRTWSSPTYVCQLFSHSCFYLMDKQSQSWSLVGAKIRRGWVWSMLFIYVRGSLVLASPASKSVTKKYLGKIEDLHTPKRAHLQRNNISMLHTQPLRIFAPKTARDWTEHCNAKSSIRYCDAVPMWIRGTLYNWEVAKSSSTRMFARI